MTMPDVQNKIAMEVRSWEPGPSSPFDNDFRGFAKHD
jgi:hypothetical protein